MVISSACAFTASRTNDPYGSDCTQFTTRQKAFPAAAIIFIWAGNRLNDPTTPIRRIFSVIAAADTVLSGPVKGSRGYSSPRPSFFIRIYCFPRRRAVFATFPETGECSQARRSLFATGAPFVTASPAFTQGITSPPGCWSRHRATAGGTNLTGAAPCVGPSLLSFRPP